jgi:hypothetical protein
VSKVTTSSSAIARFGGPAGGPGGRPAARLPGAGAGLAAAAGQLRRRGRARTGGVGLRAGPGRALGCAAAAAARLRRGPRLPDRAVRAAHSRRGRRRAVRHTGDHHQTRRPDPRPQVTLDDGPRLMVGVNVEQTASTSKSAVPRRFVATTDHARVHRPVGERTAPPGAASSLPEADRDADHTPLACRLAAVVCGARELVCHRGGRRARRHPPRAVTARSGRPRRRKPSGV